MSYPPRAMGGASRALKGWMLIPASIGVALLVALLDADSGIGTWLRMRGELAEARARIASVQRDIDGLRAEAAALRAGGFALERAIREQLGYARADETIVLMPRDESARSAFLEAGVGREKAGSR